MIFRFRAPDEVALARTLADGFGGDLTYHQVGLTRALEAPPPGFVVDRYHRDLGQGQGVFERATAVVDDFDFFNLGWVRVVKNGRPEEGDHVAALVKVFGLWTVNTARVVYRFHTTVDAVTRYGFAYGTLQHHAECGEERFQVSWSQETDEVSFEILAFSRPRHLLARLGRPWARRLQKRCGNQAMARMEALVNEL
jgi:uncharacterized protein (UPF0548 family)